MIAYEVAIWCDAADCEGSIVWDIVHLTAGASVDARAHARRHGWRRRREGGRMIDVCPEHAGEETSRG